MRELLRDVLLLQPEWTSENTPEMEKRGRLVRHDVANWLREQLPSLEIDDGDAEGSDGTGLKSEIPWTRVHSVERSPSATLGWYVVYLFSAPGDRVYLSLMQGATEWRNGEFQPRPRQELWQRATWARGVLAARLQERPDLVKAIELKARKSNLGRAYEDGNVVAFEYSLEELPSDEVLAVDLRFLGSVLRELYEILDQAVDLPPGDLAPEIVGAEIVTEQTAGKARWGQGKGQGKGLDAAERIAIERRAVDLATQYLAGEGYRVKDVGANKPYDLDARRDKEHLYVEVKGTTTIWTDASMIMLTKNEVVLHQDKYPNNMLVIVSRIALDRSVTPPTASGGELRVIHPWQIEVPNLTPVSYRYLVGE